MANTLGRGLSSLIPQKAQKGGQIKNGEAVVDITSPFEKNRVVEIPVGEISPNPLQPRRRFAPADMDDLVESIKSYGIIQPLIVTRAGIGYELIAGERRWRAAQMAQAHTVPIVIRALDDAEVLEIGILENVQRADLNPIEEAAGYAQLIERFGHTQEKLATAMGKSRSYIANALRLLTLPQPVQAMTRDGRLSAGHARALITAPNAEQLARTVVDRGLSVRDTERLAKSRDPETSLAPRRHSPGKDPDTRALEADLSAALGLSVTISPRGQGGDLRIAYATLDQLDGLCQLLNRPA